MSMAEQISPFNTDGCSSFADGTLKQKQLWLDCCIDHDKAYWQGGSVQQRLDADLALESCVTQVNEPVIAQLMLAGVRVGGSPYWPSPFRWGYGWRYPHGYTNNENATLQDNSMAIITTPLIIIIALLHLYFLILEMFLWTKPLGRKVFKLSVDYAEKSKTLAANQGLYNGFLSVGLLWGLVLGTAGITLTLFMLNCIIIAGIYGGLTVARKIFFIQAVPAMIALTLLILS